MNSKTFILLLVFCFLSDISDGQSNQKSFRQDYTYIESLKGFYKLHTTPQTWYDAKNFCALEGASLFYPENSDEAHTVLSFWNTTLPAGERLLIGMSELMNKGHFTTIDGKSVSEVYNNWFPGEPNSLGGHEHCVNLFKSGHINDCPCDYKDAFICKKTLFSLEWYKSCLLSDKNGQRDQKIFRKDYTYIESLKGFYKLHTTPQTWYDAKNFCALEGASLFYPENSDEAHTVISFWNKTLPTCERVLVGISELMTQGHFETLDGKPIAEVYNNWLPGEPNNWGGNEHCVNLYKAGHINDCPCDYKDAFICKKSLLSLDWNCVCNMSNLDYFYNEEIGKCYKLHTTPLTWTEANTVCSAEQSHLAVINSEIEANYLASLTDSAPMPRVEGNYFRGVYHLGFHNRLKEGWRTVRDTPLNADTSAWWGNHQPIGNEQCGSMFFNGRLNNIDCNIKCLFICEHEVESINLS